LPDPDVKTTDGLLLGEPGKCDPCNFLTRVDLKAVPLGLSDSLTDIDPDALGLQFTIHPEQDLGNGENLRQKHIVDGLAR
jgi:hypothetical protein